MVRMLDSEQDSATDPSDDRGLGGAESLVRRTLTRVLLPGLILLGLWATIAFLSRSSLLDVLTDFYNLTVFGDSDGNLLHEHVAMSLFRVTLGFSAAVLTAIPLGIAIGRYSLVSSVLGPVIEAMRPIPPIAWIPLSLVMFRANLIGSQVFIIWIGAFFPILIDTTTGVKRTKPVHIDVAKTFGASESQILSKIVIPSAVPEIFSGLRIGFGIGWMCLVAAEMIAGSLGLGHLVWISQQTGNTGAVIAGMALIGIVGFIVSYVFLLTERHLLKWRQDVRV